MWERLIRAAEGGSPEDIISASLRTISQDLDFHHAYSAAAAALVELGRLEEALFFRARATEISGVGYDELLKKSLGLEKIITLNSKLSRHMVVHQGHVFVGAQDGRLIAVNPKTYEYRVVLERSKEIRDIYTQVFVSDASSPIEKSKIDLTGFGKPKGPELTAEWHRYNGYTGRVVYWNGKYFRAEPEGTRVWDPDQKETRFYEGIVQHIGRHSKGWNIELSSRLQLGYGVGGISKLDSHLRPIDWVVSVPDGSASQLLINKNSFGAIVVGKERPKALQIYTHSGELIRSVDTEGFSFLSDLGQFCRVGGGYLVSGKDWIWMHPNPDVPIIRLSSSQASIPDIDPWWNDRYDWFSTPVIYDDHMFVISRYGSIYIFNLEKYFSISR